MVPRFGFGFGFGLCVLAMCAGLCAACVHCPSALAQDDVRPAFAELGVQGADAIADRDSLIVLLHGLGSRGTDFQTMARRLSVRLPGAVVLYPNAPHVYDNGASWTGYSWFDMAGSQAQASRVAAREHLVALIDQAKAVLAMGEETPVVIVGFSQGGGLAVNVGTCGDVAVELSIAMGGVVDTFCPPLPSSRPGQADPGADSPSADSPGVSLGDAPNESFSEPPREPINEPPNEPPNEPMRESVSQPPSQPVSQRPSQPVSQSLAESSGESPSDVGTLGASRALTGGSDSQIEPKSIMMVHNRGDARVPMAWGERAHRELADMGHDVSFTLYDGNQHWPVPAAMADVENAIVAALRPLSCGRRDCP